VVLLLIVVDAVVVVRVYVYALRYSGLHVLLRFVVIEHTTLFRLRLVATRCSRLFGWLLLLLDFGLRTLQFCVWFVVGCCARFVVTLLRLPRCCCCYGCWFVDVVTPDILLRWLRYVTLLLLLHVYRYCYTTLLLIFVTPPFCYAALHVTHTRCVHVCYYTFYCTAFVTTTLLLRLICYIQVLFAIYVTFVCIPHIVCYTLLLLLLLLLHCYGCYSYSCYCYCCCCCCSFIALLPCCCWTCYWLSCYDVVCVIVILLCVVCFVVFVVYLSICVYNFITHTFIAVYPLLVLVGVLHIHSDIVVLLLLIITLL